MELVRQLGQGMLQLLEPGRSHRSLGRSLAQGWVDIRREQSLQMLGQGACGTAGPGGACRWHLSS